MPLQPILPAVSRQVADRATPGPDPQELQRALESVFGQPAFRRELERIDAQARSWQELLLERLAGLWRDLLDWLEVLHLGSPVAYWLLFSFLLVLLLALLAHIGWTLRKAFRLGLPAEEGTEEAAREQVRRYRELREQAGQLAAQGELREAARLLLLALLALIEERKVLQLARGWTNREILQRLDLPAGEGAALERFRASVEAAWYGGHALDRSQIDELALCVDHCAGILRAPREEQAER